MKGEFAYNQLGVIFVQVKESMIKYISRHPVSNKNIYILHLDDLNIEIDLSKLKYFIVFLVENIDEIDITKVDSFITKLLDYGMVYLSTWGKNCELIHDITDEIYSHPDNSMRYIKDEHSNDTIMTTWHNKETLENALWFELNNATPTDSFVDNTKNIIVIVINEDVIYNKIFNYLNNLELLNRVVFK